MSWIPLVGSILTLIAGAILYLTSVAPPHPIAWTKAVAFFFGVTGIVLFVIAARRCLDRLR
jgi:cobalamin synthase